MEKVYVLTFGAINEPDLIKVFSTKEKADEEVERLKRDISYILAYAVVREYNVQ